MPAVVLACVLASAYAPAASNTVVIDATVLSATTLNASGCLSGVAGRTAFGAVAVGDERVATTACSLVFGSSNATGTLRINQTDGRGSGMWQYTRGALDPTWSGDGIEQFTSTLSQSNTGEMLGGFIDSDGAYNLVGGCGEGGGHLRELCAMRVLPTGALDLTFGGDGTAAIGLGTGQEEFAWAGTRDSQGRTLLAGSCYSGGFADIDTCVARLTTTGAADTTFSGDGVLVVDTAFGAGFDRAVGVFEHPAGGYVVFGRADGPGDNDFVVTRVTAAGALDTSYSGDGIERFNIGAAGSLDWGWSATALPDGRYAVTGTCNEGGLWSLCTAVFTSALALDTSVAGDGTVVLRYGGVQTEGVATAVDSSGRFYVGGNCMIGGTARDFCTVRLLANGAVDTTWAASGWAVHPVQAGAVDDQITALQPLDDGSLLAMGHCGPAVCSARYTSTGTLMTSYGTSGSFVVGASGSTGFGPTGALTHDGQLYLARWNWANIEVRRYAAHGVFDDYANTVRDWDSGAGDAHGHFGACLSSVTSATATWTPLAGCAQTDGASWRAIAASADAIATANPLTTAATANIHFGLRVAEATPSGNYVAPVTFTVVAA